MEITERENNYILTPLSPKLNERESLRIAAEIENIKNGCSVSDIGLNMCCVQDCTIEFIKNILSFDTISLFNIHSDIFALLISMDLDKKLNLYVSESDFIQKKHQLINRKFTLV